MTEAEFEMLSEIALAGGIVVSSLTSERDETAKALVRKRWIAMQANLSDPPINVFVNTAYGDRALMEHLNKQAEIAKADAEMLDRFAIAALTGATSGMTLGGMTDEEIAADTIEIARVVYGIADAMMAERAKRQTVPL